MNEIAVVLDTAYQPLFWHAPAGATSVLLPDSRTLWEVLWAQRHQLSGVAHLHPLGGPPRPSMTDLTTFAACEAALGRRLDWWIATPSHVAPFRHVGPGRLEYRVAGFCFGQTSAWLSELRSRGLGASHGPTRRNDHPLYRELR